MKRILHLYFCFIYLAGLCLNACSSDGGSTNIADDIVDVEAPDTDVDAGISDIGKFSSRLTRYPYITYRGADSFTLFWETDREETGYVELNGKLYIVEPEKQPLKMGPDQHIKNVYQYKIDFDYLSEEREYNYRILSLSTPFEGGFHTPSSDNNFIFAVYGDNRPGAPFMAENPTHKEITSTIAKYEPEFVINTGDIVFSGGLEDEWYLFFNDGSQLFRKAALFVAFGNHESGGEDIWKRQLLFPNGENRYYSFDWGKSHFIVLCIECGISDDTEQYRWFKQDIETADSNKNIKYIFVAFHNPPYTFSRHSPDAEARNYIVPLLKTTRTKLVFNGHNHLYEHLHKDGIHYLVSGGGGAPLYPEGEIKYEVGEEPYMVKYQMVYNFSIVYVSDTSINVKSFDNNNQLVEEFNITEE
ncbi:MAG: metallophosphoesterase family protein [Myxococcota bacterium]